MSLQGHLVMTGWGNICPGHSVAGLCPTSLPLRSRMVVIVGTVHCPGLNMSGRCHTELVNGLTTGWFSQNYKEGVVRVHLAFSSCVCVCVL